ncbi:MAG: DUF6259 domain-containing protein [candidate division WOR-3 bacterium]|nr:LamG domain-containing protein [Candidatus Omnitrophota bacterium]
MRKEIILFLLVLKFCFCYEINFIEKNLPSEVKVFSFIDSENGAKFEKEGDFIEIPYKFFPKEKGMVKIEFLIPEAKYRDQTIWRIYTKNGDGFSLGVNGKGVAWGYYCRGENKWIYLTFKLKDEEIGKWNEIKLIYKSGESLEIYFNNEKKCSEKILKKFNFVEDGVQILGNDVSKKQPFLGYIKKIKIDENIEEIENIVEINNREIIIKFKNDGNLYGVFYKNEEIIRGNGEDLWKINIKKQEKRYAISPKTFKKVNFEKNEDGETNYIKWNYKELIFPEIDGFVEYRIFLKKKVAEISFDINCHFNFKDKESSIWEIIYPNFFIMPIGNEPLNNYIVFPYSYGGKLLKDPFYSYLDKEKIFERYLYPSGSCLMQFFAIYNDKNQTGIYFSPEDSSASDKEFGFYIYPKNKTINFYLKIFPENRISTKEYKSPYLFKIIFYKGTWYEASQIYRNWFIKQEWCRKGPVYFRNDIPDWAKRMCLIVKINGDWKKDEKENRIIFENIFENISELYNFIRYPFVNVLYQWKKFYKEKSARDKPDCLAHHGNLDIPLITDVIPEIVERLNKKDIYTIAYLNARMYDYKWDEEDAKNAEKWTVRNVEGKVSLYSENSPFWDMCWYTDWWQNRFLNLCKEAIEKLKVKGIYLDSFGRRQNECFSAEHGHFQGGGNLCVMSQRKFASRLREELKRIDKDIILLNEGGTETYCDLIDIVLFSNNITPNYIPLRRAVFGDYQMGHGRRITEQHFKDPVKFYVEVSTLFLDGSIIGRLFADEIILHLPLKEGFKKNLNMYNKLWKKLKEICDYSIVGIEYLRLGKFLKPPLVKIEEKIKYVDDKLGEIEVPAVDGRCYLSYKDGSIGIIFFNRNPEKEYVFDYEFKDFREESEEKKEKFKIFLLKSTGEKIKIKENIENYKEKIRILPGEIKFYVISFN